MSPDADARRSSASDAGPILARREFLRASAAGALALAIGGSSWIACARREPTEHEFRVLDGRSAGVLRALSEVFLAGAAGGGAAPGSDVAHWIDAWLGDVPPTVASRLRGATRALDLSPWWLGTAWTRFSRGDLAARERTLLALSASRSATLRQIGSDLSELVVFSIYSQPHSWARLGYDGPWVRAASRSPQ